VPLPRVAVGRPWCVGPAVGTSGGGGLARRSITTSVASVVLAVVAAAITAIVVFVVILRPIAAVATRGGRDGVEDGGLAAEDAMLV
jgi:hypothetical protein